MNRRGIQVAVLIAAVAIVLGGWGLLKSRRGDAPAASPSSTPAALPAAPASSAAGKAASAVSAEAAPAPSPEAATALSLDELPAALEATFGRKAVLSLLQTTDFPRRIAATVDNLGREHAPSSVWPVNPSPERFLVRTVGGDSTIDSDNALRYTPFVLMTETADLHQVVGLYRRMYPLLQAAYVDLGFPGRVFHERLLAVIDQLLATPEPTGPLKVVLPEVRGPERPARPWVLYQFADPALESLSAGQKVLLRVGPTNERRLKARLAELRILLGTAAPSPPSPSPSPAKSGASS